MISTAEAKPVSEIMVERKPKLLARLHQTEHDIARNTASRLTVPPDPIVSELTRRSAVRACSMRLRMANPMNLLYLYILSLKYYSTQPKLSVSPGSSR